MYSASSRRLIKSYRPLDTTACPGCAHRPSAKVTLFEMTETERPTRVLKVSFALSKTFYYFRHFSGAL